MPTENTSAEETYPEVRQEALRLAWHVSNSVNAMAHEKVIIITSKLALYTEILAWLLAVAYDDWAGNQLKEVVEEANAYPEVRLFNSLDMWDGFVKKLTQTADAAGIVYERKKAYQAEEYSEDTYKNAYKELGLSQGWLKPDMRFFSKKVRLVVK